MASLIQRNGKYHVQWYEGKAKRRLSLSTDSLQIAKEKLRQFESAQFRGDGCPLPTRTPVDRILAGYIEHMKLTRPENSWRKDLGYLRALFGECCTEPEIRTGRDVCCCHRDRRS